MLIILSYHHDDVFDNTFCYLDYSWLHLVGFGCSGLVGRVCLLVHLPDKCQIETLSIKDERMGKIGTVRNKEE